jgi:hypothetical protein
VGSQLASLLHIKISTSISFAIINAMALIERLMLLKKLYGIIIKRKREKVFLETFFPVFYFEGVVQPFLLH